MALEERHQLWQYTAALRYRHALEHCVRWAVELVEAVSGLRGAYARSNGRPAAVYLKAAAADVAALLEWCVTLSRFY